MKHPPFSRRAPSGNHPAKPAHGSRHSGKKVTLDRLLSKSGFCSRSQARILIISGRVHINNHPETNPDAWVDPERALVSIDGQKLQPSAFRYLMLNKPAGLVTTAADEKSRETVYQCLDLADLSWISPVGRLDKASEGLLLFTNDTAWAARITDPETHLDKTYHVQIDSLADEMFLKTIQQGVKTSSGEILSVKRARLLRTGTRNCWLEIVLDEGKNRQIRRILEGLGLNVLRLFRISMGPLQLGDLAKGQTRDLTPEEKAALDQAMSRKKSRPKG